MLAIVAAFVTLGVRLRREARRGERPTPDFS
jgi:hypothetical protein